MKIAGVQMDVTIGNVDKNLERMKSYMNDTVSQGVQLTVFPECAATGYCFESLEEGRQFADPIPGPIVGSMEVVCRELNTYCVFGMLELDGDRVFNACVLVGPDGWIATYRKVHLPYLGIDMFTTPGDRPFAVHNAGDLRIGMNICYDAAFPEATRSLAVLGADLVVLPTNWPPGAECMAEHSIRTRAMENGIYFAAVNRVGTERGVTFIGNSSICDPSGNVMATAGSDQEEILYADIDIERARRKHIRRVPDKHEIDRFADRRPEMYSTLVESHELLTPRQRHS